MLHAWAKKLAQWLCKENDLPDRAEVYCYGIETALDTLINIVATVLLGLLFHGLWICILFLAFYIPLRSNAGGYHASTYLRCFCWSCVILIVVMCLAKTFTVAWPLQAALFVPSAVVVWCLSPVGNINNLPDEAEIKVFGKRARVVLSIESVTFIVLLCCGLEKLAFPACLSFVGVTVMLLIGKLELFVIKLRSNKC